MTDNKPQKRELRIQTLQLPCQFEAGNEDVALITDNGRCSNRIVHS